MGPALSIGLPLAFKFLAPLLAAGGGAIIDLINKKHGTPAKDDPQKPVIDAKKAKEWRDFITSMLQIAAGNGWIPAIPADDPAIDGAAEMFFRVWKTLKGGTTVPTPADPTVTVPSASAFSFVVSVKPVTL